MRALRRATAIRRAGALAAATTAATTVAAVVALAAPAGAADAPLADVAARAVLVDHDGRTVGTADLASTARGLRITLHVEGLEPGEHGVHVHERGSCTDADDPATDGPVDFGGAGGHFDPDHTGRHGSPYARNDESHAGDVPNVPVRDDGIGDLLWTTGRLSFVGPDSVIGRSLLVDTSGDDQVTQPDGGSGAHLACGVILAQPTVVTARYALPDDDAFPEGIATDTAGTTAYVGSAATGALYRIDPATGTSAVLSPGGSDGRTAALGLHLDPFGHLLVAGGATGTVAVVDPATGATLATLSTPPAAATFLNDIAVTADGTVYVTDSLRPVVFRAHATAEGVSPLEPWLDLSDGPVSFTAGFNLNGIVAPPDGHVLLAVQTNTGQLWRIDPATGAVTEVVVDGLEIGDPTGGAGTTAGPFPGGDGLVLAGDALTVVQNASGTLTRLRLDADDTRASVVAVLHDADLRFPTTAAPLGDRLLVVNSQLDQQAGGAPVLPFVVTAVPADLGVPSAPPVLDPPTPPAIQPPGPVPPGPQPPM